MDPHGPRCRSRGTWTWLVPSPSSQGRRARASQGTATREAGAQRHALQEKRLPLMTNGVNRRTKPRQLSLREMRRDRREKHFLTEERQSRQHDGAEGRRNQKRRGGHPSSGRSRGRIHRRRPRGGCRPEARWARCPGPGAGRDRAGPGLLSSGLLGSRAKPESDAGNGPNAGCSVRSRGRRRARRARPRPVPDK